MEHRWGERVVVDVPVKLTARPSSVRWGRLVNLSVSGAYISATFDLRVLSRIQIVADVPLPFRHATPVIPAYVTRTLKGGIGVEWCDFAPRFVIELIRLARPRRQVRPVVGEGQRVEGHWISEARPIAEGTVPSYPHALASS